MAAADRPERWICDGEPSARYPIWTRGNVGEVFPWPVTPATWTPRRDPVRRARLARRAGALRCLRPRRVQRRATPRSSGASAATATSTRRSPGSSACAPRASPRSRWTTRCGARWRASRPTRRCPATTTRRRPRRSRPRSGGSSRRPSSPTSRPTSGGWPSCGPAGPTSTPCPTPSWSPGSAATPPSCGGMFAEHLYITYCSTVPLGVIQGVCTAIGDPTLAMTLVAGIGGVDSAAPSYAFWEMGRHGARRRRRSPPRSTPGVDGLLDRLRARRRRRRRRRSSRRSTTSLYEFGSRGPNEWETSAPSWETDPELPLAAIDRMRLADDDQAPRHHQEAMAAAREAAIPGVLAAVEGDPETHGQLSAALAAAPVFLAGRERTKTNIIRLVNEMRVGSHALGQRMVERGYYTKPTSGSMLERRRARRSSSPIPSAWVDTIKEREAQYERAVRPRAAVRVRRRGAAAAHLGRARDRRPRRWPPARPSRASPAVPGQATGRARVVLDPCRPDRARARRRAHRADHRPGVDAAVRARPPPWSSTSAPSSATR